MIANYRFVLLIVFMLSACQVESGAVQTATYVPTVNAVSTPLIPPQATVESTATSEATIPAQSTADLSIPTPQHPSDEESVEAWRILQDYFSKFPFLIEDRNPYQERWGCLGTSDVGGVLGYDTQYSSEEVRQAFLRYLQQANWEYTENTSTSDNAWPRTSFIATKEDKQKPYMAYLRVQIFDKPAIPTESIGAVPDEDVKIKSNLLIHIAHIESVDPYQNLYGGLGSSFYKICPDGWWLTW